MSQQTKKRKVRTDAPSANVPSRNGASTNGASTNGTSTNGTSKNGTHAAEQTQAAPHVAVLLVQMDPEQRQKLADQLTQAGYIVVTAAGGGDAVELCEHFAFAAVVWDVPPAPDVEAALEAMRRWQPKLACCLMEYDDNVGEPRRTSLDDTAHVEQIKRRLLHTLR
jgi:CheY-like chemotaxis protein